MNTPRSPTSVAATLRRYVFCFVCMQICVHSRKPPHSASTPVPHNRPPLPVRAHDSASSDVQGDSVAGRRLGSWQRRRLVRRRSGKQLEPQKQPQALSRRRREFASSRHDRGSLSECQDLSVFLFLKTKTGIVLGHYRRLSTLDSDSGIQRRVLTSS
jgi:hypothetical protein